MDTYVQALVMGIVQGLTEFLPISSSGHLIIVPFLFGWTDPFITSLAFSVMLHIGTLARAARLLPGRLAPAGPGRLRRRSAIARSAAIRTAGWRGCSSRRRSRPRIAGFLLNDLIETTVPRGRSRRGRRSSSAPSILWLADRWGGRDARASTTSRSRSRIGDRRGPGAGARSRASADRASPSRPAGSPGSTARRPPASRFLMATPITAGAAHLRGPQAASPARPASTSSLGPLRRRDARGVRRRACSRSRFLLRYLRTRSLTIFVVYRLVAGGGRRRRLAAP